MHISSSLRTVDKYTLANQHTAERLQSPCNEVHHNLALFINCYCFNLHIYDSTIIACFIFLPRMEPASIVSLTGACLTLVMRTAKDLNDIVSKFRNVDHKVTLIEAQLNTITATISRLKDWLKTQQQISHGIYSDLSGAIGACTTVVSQLNGYITSLGKGRFKSKVKWVWEDSSLSEYQSALASQIAALGLFLNVILL